VWLLAVIAVMAGLVSPGAAGENRPNRPAVLLVSIDGFRADDLIEADRL
jgi:hypothetical protein